MLALLKNYDPLIGTSTSLFQLYTIYEHIAPQLRASWMLNTFLLSFNVERADAA